MNRSQVLEVPKAVYSAMRLLMQAAGHDVPEDGGLLDLTGLALRPRPGGKSTSDLTVSTLLSRTTKEGRVEMSLNGELTQMDLDKAREVVGMLHEAIEAAVSDQLMFTFLVQRVGLSEDSANKALMDFREYRQGSREIVHPN